MYLIYGYEIFRDYRRVKCLLISQILDLYVIFYVRYRILKLKSKRTKHQFWAIFSILKCCVFIFRHKYTSAFFFNLLGLIERYKKKLNGKKLPHAVVGKLAPKMLHFRLFSNFALYEHLKLCE